MTLKSNLFRISIIFFLIVFSISSCYKKKDTIAIIHVKDSLTSDVMVDIEVTLDYLSGNSDSLIFYNENGENMLKAMTNPQGEAVFNFNEYYNSGQAGFMVLDVLISGTKVDVIQIEEETTTEETVYL